MPWMQTAQAAAAAAAHGYASSSRQLCRGGKIVDLYYCVAPLLGFESLLTVVMLVVVSVVL